ncbi:hypothetical protein ABZT06_41755 [Streptomyces sp. NPDC005483]|uniref:hypothetical protein n=1 Tax=Streptomyces sp. NPDC005483 TaxID=3154882 RepID=UPI0033A00421
MFLCRAGLRILAIPLGTDYCPPSLQPPRPHRLRGLLSQLGEDGAHILPTLYDDNYLWLLPGETRTATLPRPASARPSGRPKLRVEGHNTTPITVRG